MDAKIDLVTHQKWSGANYVDNLLKMVTGGVSSTSAMGKGVTGKFSEILEGILGKGDDANDFVCAEDQFH